MPGEQLNVVQQSLWTVFNNVDEDMQNNLAKYVEDEEGKKHLDKSNSLIHKPINEQTVKTVFAEYKAKLGSSGSTIPAYIRTVNEVIEMFASDSKQAISTNSWLKECFIGNIEHKRFYVFVVQTLTDLTQKLDSNDYDKYLEKLKNLRDGIQAVREQERKSDELDDSKKTLLLHIGHITNMLDYLHERIQKKKDNQTLIGLIEDVQRLGDRLKDSFKNVLLYSAFQRNLHNTNQVNAGFSEGALVDSAMSVEDRVNHMARDLTNRGGSSEANCSFAIESYLLKEAMYDGHKYIDLVKEACQIKLQLLRNNRSNKPKEIEQVISENNIETRLTCNQAQKLINRIDNGKKVSHIYKLAKYHTSTEDLGWYQRGYEYFSGNKRDQNYYEMILDYADCCEKMNLAKENSEIFDTLKSFTGRIGDLGAVGVPGFKKRYTLAFNLFKETLHQALESTRAWTREVCSDFEALQKHKSEQPETSHQGESANESQQLVKRQPSRGQSASTSQRQLSTNRAKYQNERSSSGQGTKQSKSFREDVHFAHYRQEMNEYLRKVDEIEGEIERKLEEIESYMAHVRSDAYFDKMQSELKWIDEKSKKVFQKLQQVREGYEFGLSVDNTLIVDDESLDEWLKKGASQSGIMEDAPLMIEVLREAFVRIDVEDKKRKGTECEIRAVPANGEHKSTEQANDRESPRDPIICKIMSILMQVKNFDELEPQRAHDLLGYLILAGEKVSNREDLGLGTKDKENLIKRLNNTAGNIDNEMAQNTAGASNHRSASKELTVQNMYDVMSRIGETLKQQIGEQYSLIDNFKEILKLSSSGGAASSTQVDVAIVPYDQYRHYNATTMQAMLFKLLQKLMARACVPDDQETLMPAVSKAKKLITDSGWQFDLQQQQLIANEASQAQDQQIMQATPDVLQKSIFYHSLVEAAIEYVNNNKLWKDRQRRVVNCKKQDILDRLTGIVCRNSQYDSSEYRLLSWQEFSAKPLPEIKRQVAQFANNNVSTGHRTFDKLNRELAQYAIEFDIYCRPSARFNMDKLLSNEPAAQSKDQKLTEGETPRQDSMAQVADSALSCIFGDEATPVDEATSVLATRETKQRSSKQQKQKSVKNEQHEPLLGAQEVEQPAKVNLNQYLPENARTNKPIWVERDTFDRMAGQCVDQDAIHESVKRRVEEKGLRNDAALIIAYKISREINDNLQYHKIQCLNQQFQSGSLDNAVDQNDLLNIWSHYCRLQAFELFEKYEKSEAVPEVRPQRVNEAWDERHCTAEQPEEGIELQNLGSQSNEPATYDNIFTDALKKARDEYKAWKGKANVGSRNSYKSAQALIDTGGIKNVGQFVVNTFACMGKKWRCNDRKFDYSMGLLMLEEGHKLVDDRHKTRTIEKTKDVNVKQTTTDILNDFYLKQLPTSSSDLGVRNQFMQAYIKQVTATVYDRCLKGQGKRNWLHKLKQGADLDAVKVNKRLRKAKGILDSLQTIIDKVSNGGIDEEQLIKQLYTAMNATKPKKQKVSADSEYMVSNDNLDDDVKNHVGYLTWGMSIFSRRKKPEWTKTAKLVSQQVDPAYYLGGAQQTGPDEGSYYHQPRAC